MGITRSPQPNTRRGRGLKEPEARAPGDGDTGQSCPPAPAAAAPQKWPLHPTPMPGSCCCTPRAGHLQRVPSLTHPRDKPPVAIATSPGPDGSFPCGHVPPSTSRQPGTPLRVPCPHPGAREQAAALQTRRGVPGSCKARLGGPLLGTGIGGLRSQRGATEPPLCHGPALIKVLEMMFLWVVGTKSKRGVLGSHGDAAAPGCLSFPALSSRAGTPPWLQHWGPVIAPSKRFSSTTEP